MITDCRWSFEKSDQIYFERSSFYLFQVVVQNPRTAAHIFQVVCRRLHRKCFFFFCFVFMTNAFCNFSCFLDERWSNWIGARSTCLRSNISRRTKMMEGKSQWQFNLWNNRLMWEVLRRGRSFRWDERESACTCGTSFELNWPANFASRRSDCPEGEYSV